ncbi:hypothetical protein BX666DRAFT_1995799, partial [Dichotomocladium elegans]
METMIPVSSKLTTYLSDPSWDIQITHCSHHVLTHPTSGGIYHRDLIGTSNHIRSVHDDPHEQWVLVRENPKQCHSCGTTSTPEWRKGPMGKLQAAQRVIVHTFLTGMLLGPRTLCNACGLLWAKLARNQRDVQKQVGPNIKKEKANKQPGREIPTNANKCALSFLL